LSEHAVISGRFADYTGLKSALFINKIKSGSPRNSQRCGGRQENTAAEPSAAHEPIQQRRGADRALGQIVAPFRFCYCVKMSQPTGIGSVSGTPIRQQGAVPLMKTMQAVRAARDSTAPQRAD
jgi:hypothetical protein